VSDEPTGFLYPFIEREELDLAGLMTDLTTSAQAKIRESHGLQTATLDRCAADLDRAGRAMAERFERGGRLFTFGNGGSATDAARTADLFRHPPYGRPLPASSLVEDQAVLTALANDVGFELVFSRQLIARAQDGDIALGLSTSGGSVNLLRAFAEAQRRGVLAVGLAGYQGGAMASSGDVEHCFVVRSDSVHRIQESQAALVFALWRTVEWHLGERSDA